MRNHRITWAWYTSNIKLGRYFIIALNVSSHVHDHYAVTDDFGQLVKVPKP
jgi:hypothetical protein